MPCRIMTYKIGRRKRHAEKLLEGRIMSVGVRVPDLQAPKKQGPAKRFFFEPPIVHVFGATTSIDHIIRAQKERLSVCELQVSRGGAA